MANTNKLKKKFRNDIKNILKVKNTSPNFYLPFAKLQYYPFPTTLTETYEKSENSFPATVFFCSCMNFN